MTVLGAVLYGGFFALAALWLFLTADGDTADTLDQDQRHERSNSTSASADAAGSRPCLVSHSSQK
jgi:hypothetical protein